MRDSSDTHRVTFIVLRYMRRPILVLVSVYAISMVGWAVIPGVDIDGDKEPLSFFHAFYFLTYTATTTGFGEIPYEFSDAQRMWSIVSLYAGVVAWLYAAGSIVRLLQNPHFRQSLAERRFARFVSRINGPFVIVCGFGNTGSLLARGLSDSGVTAVVIDINQDRINALNLRDYRVAMPGLCGNARVPAHLVEAGLARPKCRAVVALTGDEEVNLKIAVATRLLNPQASVVIQSTSEVHEEAIATLGGDVHIVDPFQTYARYLGATIGNPHVYALNRWLVGEHGANLADIPSTPLGKWILCGFGRMGRRINESLEAHGIDITIIEPAYPAGEEIPPNLIIARADQRALRAAGIESADGLVAATDDDAYNLSIVLNARALNPGVFVIVRQDLHMNEQLYARAGAHLIMQPSLVSARRILFLLIAPELKSLFERVRNARMEDEDGFLARVFDELNTIVGGETSPRLWTVDITEPAAPAVVSVLSNGESVTLADIVKEPDDCNGRLPCVPLVLRRKDAIEVMPTLATEIRTGDQILFCGRERAVGLLDATLANEYTLRYFMTGVEPPRGHVMRWLVGRGFTHTPS